MADACACGTHGCRECRLRAFGLGRRRYVWTAARHEALRAAYALESRAGRAAAVARLAAAYEWPEYAVRYEAQRLGIAPASGRRPWTVAEEKYLQEKLGNVSVRRIAQVLRRGVAAVESHAERMRLSRRAADGYTVADLSRVFGVHEQSVRRWYERGLFGRVRQWQGRRVSSESVVEFLRRCPHEYDLRRVDQSWFKAMVFGAQ